MKVKCLNATCGKIRVITRKEQFRASRPKCLACGNGQFEEIVKEEKSEKVEEPQEVANA